MADIGSQQSRLCLSIPNFTGIHLFPLLMGDFHHEYPDIFFEVKQCNSIVAFKFLNNGTCDAAIVVEPETLPENMEMHRVFSSEFVFCVNSSHPLAGAKELSLAEIESHPLILNHEESFMTRQIKKRFYDEGLVPNILLYAVQLPLIKQFVYSGKAGTFLSKELAESLPEIIAIPLKEKVPINFALVWNKDKFRSRNLRILTDYILAKSPIQK